MSLFKNVLVGGLLVSLGWGILAQESAGAPAASPPPSSAAASPETKAPANPADPAAKPVAPLPSAAPASGPDFGLAFDLGYNPIYSPGNKEMETWQRVGFRPELSLGSFGVGLNLDINFRFNGGADKRSFEIRPEDWVISANRNFLEVYLPKIRYIRYGHKGEPLYLSFGNIEHGVMGNGFIVSDYNNTLYQPDQRVFGMNFDLDGKLFSFPYVGLETMVGNFAAWDLVAMRIYIRPAAGLDVKILDNMQIGFTLAADTNPYYYSPDAGIKANYGRKAVGIWGVDLLTPLISSDQFGLDLIADLAMQTVNFGTQIGVKGNALKFLTYKAILRYQATNYVSDYFDSLYDLQRQERQAVYESGNSSAAPYAGWLASIGCSFLEGAFYCNATVSGPFNAADSVVYRNPDLKAVIGLKQGVLGGLGLQGSYEKANIPSFQSLADPTGAVIGANLSYALGPAVIRLVYQVSYDPYARLKGLSSNWQINSKIETSIVLIGTGVTP